MVHSATLYYLEACSDGKPVQRTSQGMHPLQYYGGLQKHPGMWGSMFKCRNNGKMRLVRAVLLYPRNNP